MYSIEFSTRARRELNRLPPQYAGLVGRGIDGLSENPRPRGSLRLQARPGYRLRVGSYRVIYQVDDAARLVIINRVGHRRDVYR